MTSTAHPPSHAHAGAHARTLTLPHERPPAPRERRGRTARRAAAALCLGLLSMAGSARGELIVNGSFEFDPATAIANPSGNYRDYGSWIRLAPGTSFLTGWKVAGFGAGPTLGVDWHLGTGTPAPAQNGLRMIDLHIDGTGGQGPGQGTISQTFTTVPGMSYLLGFWLAGPRSSAQGGTLDPRQVNVDITGSPTRLFSAPSSDPNNLQWYQQTFGFQAIAGNTTLTFSPPAGTGPSGFWGAFLDNVSVSQVPEPPALTLLAAGLAALMLRRRTGQG